MKAFIIKLAASVVSNAKSRKGVIIAVLSIIAGFLGLILLPAAVLMSIMGEVEPPDTDFAFDKAAWMQSLNSEQQAQITQMESDGQTIADVMNSLEIQEQTIKAQLLYFSCFDDVDVDDFEVYCKLFKDSPDDQTLIENLNQTYGTEIVYEDFMRTYAMVMTATINPYMFTDTQTKNSTDLVIWANNALDNGWGCVYGTYGNILTEEILQDRAEVFGSNVTDYEDFIRENLMKRRTADSVGLIKGYGWYDASTGDIVVGANGILDVTANEMFEAATVKGTIDTMPDTPGLAVWQDGHIGIYIGNGEVIEAMGTEDGVVKKVLADGAWTHWLEIPYISYAELPQEPATEESQEAME